MSTYYQTATPGLVVCEECEEAGRPSLIDTADKATHEQRVDHPGLLYE